MVRNKLLLVAGVLAASALVSACGGGSDNKGVYFPPVVINPPPPTSDGAVDGFIAFVRQLVANPTETGEPVAVTQYDPPPTSETLEPVTTP